MHPSSLLPTTSLLLGLCLVVASRPARGADTFRFNGYQRLTNKEFALRLTAPAGSAYRVEISSNALDWNSLVTFTGLGMNQHTDAAAPYFNPRYYRALQLPGTTNLTGDHLVTDAGDVVIHPVDHASFVLSWNGKTIYNDPVGGSTPYTSFARADLILVSHNHGDHYSSSTLTAVKSAGGVIVAPAVVYNAMSTTLKAATTVLTNRGTLNVMGVTIEAVPAYNSRHPLGEGNGYVITLGGKRLYMSGDTGDIAEMRALTNIDVAFVAMNVPYTMTIAQAASAVRAFRPKVVYPYHFENEDGTFADLNSFKSQVGTDLGIEVRPRKWY